MEKIIDWKDIHTILPRTKGRKTVLVGGCFDVFHFGHLVFLNEAKRLGDVLIVALESDEFISINKRIPAHPQKQRAEILAALEIIDFVILLPYLKKDSDYSDLAKIIHPTYIAVSQKDEKLEIKQKQAEEVGAQLRIVAPHVKEYSSSRLINHATIPCD